MSTHDLQGREYARLSKLSQFDLVEVDGDFICMNKGDRYAVDVDEEGRSFLHCNCNRHYLDGQLDDCNDDHLTGIYKVEN